MQPFDTAQSRSPLLSDECDQNCSEYHLIPHYLAFGETCPLQAATLLRPTELYSSQSVPSASKKPLCETTRAAWKNWAGKLFDEKRKLFPNEIFATKCSVSLLTIQVVGNFHLKIFPMENRFSSFLSVLPHLPLQIKITCVKNKSNFSVRSPEVLKIFSGCGLDAILKISPYILGLRCFKSFQFQYEILSFGSSKMTENNMVIPSHGPQSPLQVMATRKILWSFAHNAVHLFHASDSMWICLYYQYYC